MTTDNVPIEFLNKFNITQIPIIFSDFETRENIVRNFVKTIMEVAQIKEEMLKTNILFIMADEK